MLFLIHKKKFNCHWIPIAVCVFPWGWSKLLVLPNFTLGSYRLPKVYSVVVFSWGFHFWLLKTLTEFFFKLEIAVCFKKFCKYIMFWFCKQLLLCTVWVLGRAFAQSESLSLNGNSYKRHIFLTVNTSKSFSDILNSSVRLPPKGRRWLAVARASVACRRLMRCHF